jgi:hypothetical protein
MASLWGVRPVCACEGQASSVVRRRLGCQCVLFISCRPRLRWVAARQCGASLHFDAVMWLGCAMVQTCCVQCREAECDHCCEARKIGAVCALTAYLMGALSMWGYAVIWILPVLRSRSRWLNARLPFQAVSLSVDFWLLSNGDM